MDKLKIAVIAVQLGYLKKLTGQLQAMFGDRIQVRSFSLSMLDKEQIEPDEVVFSAIPNLDRLVAASFPKIRGYVRARRSINLVNTGGIMALEKGQRVLVVGDHADVIQKSIRELMQCGFDHHYIPYHPGVDLSDAVDCAVTTGEVELVPPGVDHVINIGLRVISLTTMMELNQRFGLGLSPVEANRQYTLSLVHVSANWPVSRKNKYLSTWIGTPRDDQPDQTFADFIAQSPAMQAFIRQAKSLCPGDHPVHIDGAMGVGKRRVAIAIHNEAPKALPPRAAPQKNRGGFFHMNCTSQARDLDRALFGWEEAGDSFPGLLESRGTVCIEEIENMPLDLQEKLASCLTDRCLIRTGGSEAVPARARVVTTGTVPLTRAFAGKRIRQPLYHHLSLYVCTMPALSQRKEDFHLLIEKFLAHDLNRPDLAIEPDALETLRAHTWEGNVQEFYNVIYHLACLGEKTITRNMLPFYILRDTVPPLGGKTAHPSGAGHLSPDASPGPAPALEFKAIIQEIESHGFLDEYLKVLEIYDRGRQENQSFGRARVIERLKAEGIHLTRQQLRLKQERLNDLGLLRVMRGRAGTTISDTGKAFLNRVRKGR